MSTPTAEPSRSIALPWGQGGRGAPPRWPPPPAEPSRSIALPWGQGPPLRLEVPEAWELADVAWPDLSEPLNDYPTALDRALEASEGGLTIESAIGPGST